MSWAAFIAGVEYGSTLNRSVIKADLLSEPMFDIIELKVVSSDVELMFW
jgi:hypothetical protein